MRNPESAAGQLPAETSISLTTTGWDRVAGTPHDYSANNGVER